MTEPKEVLKIDRAPDGMTKPHVSRLRAKYKKLKPQVIENIIDLLADPESKSSDVANKFKIIEAIEAMLNIVPGKVDQESDSKKDSLSEAMDALKADLGAE